jgi:type I restriction enzyme S subunit
MPANKQTLQELPTDLEELPSGWRYQPLGSLVDEKRGISYGVVQPGSHSTEGVPIVRVNNLKNGRIETHDVLRVTKEIESNHQRTRLRGNEVLLSLVGSLGECAVVPNELAGWNVARAVAVIPVLEEIGAMWVALCLRSKPLQHYIFTWATTTVQATLNLRDVVNLPIPIPPKAERDAIAHILGSLDDKIELNRRMNATLEAIAQALFKSWFVDFDPVRAKAEGRQPYGMDADTAALFPASFQDSVLGEIPESWQVLPLDKVAGFLNGLALQKYPAQGEDYLPVIKIAQLRKNSTEGSDRASRSVPPAYIVHDGDVLFSWSGSLEAVIWTGGTGALNQHLFKVTSKQFPKWFYYLWVRHHLPDFQAIAAGKATTMGHIQRHHLSSALTLVPNKEALDYMNRHMQSQIDKLIANDLESRTLTNLRDALLPRLLSGEIRVKEAEELVEAHA